MVTILTRIISAWAVWKTLTAKPRTVIAMPITVRLDGREISRHVVKWATRASK